ncbi:MAG: TonB-dependent receptor [Pseudomonadales bacterium]|nr:TonB-dependent receptor [Pseudomonadales bacterium]
MSISRRLISLTLLSGASTLNADTANRIEQIIVSGVRTEQPALNSPAAVSVITREDIERSGALTVAEALRGRAGLQIRDTIGDGGRGVVVSMRGFGENAPNNTLVLVDGRRLNNPTLAGPDLNSISIKDIERIEILQGGAGVLFGDQAVGGVINVITRTPDKAALALEAGGGTHNAERYAASASQRFANGIGVRLSAEQRESDNYRDNNATEYTNALGLLEYNWNDGRVFAELQRIDDDLELPGALPEALARQDRRQSLDWYAQDFADLQTTTWRLGGRYALTPVWSAEMEITERENDGDGYQSAPNTTEMQVASVNPRLVGRFERPAGTATLTLGFDATDSEYLLDIPEFSFRTDFEQEQRDSYAQLVYPLTETVQVSAGARRSEVDDDNRGNDMQNGDGATVTTASIAWYFRPEMRLLLRRDEVLRYASVDENGYTLPGVAFLEPQTGASWEGGLEWFDPRFNGRAMLFDLELDDEILYDPSALGSLAEFGIFGANINLDSSRRRGALLEWRWQALQRLSLGGSYTWTDAEITAGTFDGNEVPYVAQHVGALNTTWDVGRGISAFVEYAYNGSRYALGDDANAYSRIDAEGVLNMALRWASGHWNATLRANNLNDEEYDSLTSVLYGERSVYPAPERTLYLTLGYTL